jgi:hypothetical protein
VHIAKGPQRRKYNARKKGESKKRKWRGKKRKEGRKGERTIHNK